MKSVDKEIVKIFRQEWKKRVALLESKIDVPLVAKDPENGISDTVIVSPELKVVHRESGIRYTVDSVSPRDVILRSPEGETFLVHGGEFEADYRLS